MTRKLLLACCLFLLFYGAAGAQVPNIKALIEKDTIAMRYDSSKVAVRHYNAAALEKLRKDPEFIYKKEAGGQTWWDRFWIWLWQWLEKIFGGEHKAAQPVPYGKDIAIVLIVGLAVYIIMKLAGLTHIFSRKPKQVPIAYTESLENINEINFDAAIEKAWNEGNYRLGVRLLYLQSLKQLNDARLINWQIGKTNHTYLNELTDEDKRNSFAVLTNQFEYIWYGDFPIERDAYQRINVLFTNFKKSLA